MIEAPLPQRPRALDDDLRPLERGGRYLDPEAAAAAAEAVANQGR